MRDILLYVAIGLGFLGGILWLAIGRPDVSFSQFHVWGSFLFFTMLLAIVLAKMYWPVRRVWRVWLLLAIFMAVHTLGYVVFLLRVHGLPGYWYWFTCPVEVVLFAAIAWRWLKVNPPISGRL